MIKLELILDDLDYDVLIDRFLPQLTDQLRASGNPVGMLLSNGMPANMAKSILASLSQEKKDQLAADLLNAMRPKLIRQAKTALDQQGISLTVVDAHATAQ